MLIGELSCRTGVPARLLRYYEEQDLLHPERDGNGYRHYGAADVDRVEQIRGLLDSGLTTEIIRRILPYLGCGIHLPAQCWNARPNGSGSASTASAATAMRSSATWPPSAPPYRTAAASRPIWSGAAVVGTKMSSSQPAAANASA